MKTTITLCTALLMGGAILTAQDTTPATTGSSYAVTVDFPHVTKYVFRGIQIARASFQPSVELAYGDFYAGVWNNTPLNNENDNEVSKEYDLYLGYAKSISERLKADVGITAYLYPSVTNKVIDGDSLEAFVGLNWTIGNFTPSVYVYRDFELKQWTAQGSIGFSVPLKDLGASVDFNVTGGAVSADKGADYRYWSAGVNVPVKLTDTATLNLGLTYAANDLEMEEDAGVWSTIGITASF